MARTSRYQCETKKKCKPSSSYFLSWRRRRDGFVSCDLVMHCLISLCILLAITSTSLVNAKVTVTGSGGYSSRRIQLDLADGGYKGIVVKIDKEVPEKHCPKILANIKSLFRQSSAVLHKALNENVFFKSITIVVPSTWRDGKCQEMIRPPKDNVPYREPDVKVTLDHPIFKSAPQTQQSRQCGMRGDFIHLPYSFLTAWNETRVMWGNPAKLFVHEWMKLRYGIFDEFGFTGDSMYPNYFHHDGQILPTGTSNVPLKGLWLNSNGETGCHPGTDRDCFYHLQGRNDGMTCSLGYLHFLPNVTSYCDNRSEKSMPPMSPTKHNILCEGKSAREVIDDNLDFKLLNSYRQLFTSHKFEPYSSSKAKLKNNPLAPTIIRQNIDPKFNIVREPLEQYVLVMETSRSMDNHEQWKWINKAAQKFIRYDLPVNSNLGIVTFSNSSKVEHSMVQVHSDQVRARLADTIPDKYHLSRSEKRCVLCSLQKVLNEVIRDNRAGAHIILITQGSSDTLSLTDEEVIRGYVLDYNIKLSSILLPETGTSYLPFYDSVGTLMNGKTYIVKNNNHIIDFYVRLNEAFADILRSDARYPTEIPELVYKQEFVGGDLQAASTAGNFLIDSTLGRDTQFGIYVEDEEEHLIKSITFKDSKGKMYGPFTRMSSSFDLVNFKTINFPAGQAPPFNAPHQIGMTWQYDIEWHNGGNRKDRHRTITDLSKSTSSRRIEGGKKKNSDITNSSPNYEGDTGMNVVVVTSKPRSQTAGNLITTHTWTSLMEKEDTKQPNLSPNNFRNINITYSHQNDDNNSTILYDGEKGETEMKPLVIYTQVLRGSSPIFKAKVILSVIVEQANGSTIVLQPMELKDDGYGDPDLVEGDGIYSRYLGHHKLTGRYKFIVTIHDNDNQAFYISNTNLGRKNNRYKSLVMKRKMLLSQRQQQISSQQAKIPNPSNTFKRDVMSLTNDKSLIPNYTNVMLQVTRNRCCGSSVLNSLQLTNFPQKAIKTGIFRRTADGPAIHVKYTEEEPIHREDLMPPSKIGDLKIVRLPNTSDKLLASWTSPGGDFDIGSVSSYRFVYSHNIADLIDTKNGGANILLGFERMEKEGTKAKFDFSFPHHEKDYYIGTYAFDLAGNRGKISNLVHVRIPAPPSAGGILGEGKPYGAADNDANNLFDVTTDTNWIMIGAIGGVILVLLVLGLAIISYYFAVARKRSKGKTGSTSSVMNGGSSDETDSSSFDSDIKNIMANPLGPSLPLPSSAHSHSSASQKYHQRTQPSSQLNYQHQHHGHHNTQSYNGVIGGQQIGGTIASSINNSPSDHQTKHSNSVTPVYWSASQLLSKLDHPIQSNGLGQYSQNYGNPYVNAVQTDIYSVNDVGEPNGGHAYAPHGPHSLQPMLSPSSLLSSQHNHYPHTHHQQHPGLLSVGQHTLNHVQHGPNSLHNASFADTRSYAMMQNTSPPDWAYPHHPHSVSLSAQSGIIGSHNKHEYSMDSPSHHHCNHPDIPEEYTITVGNLNVGGVDGGSPGVGGVIDTSNSMSETPVPNSNGMAPDSVNHPQAMAMKPRNITQV